MSNGQFGRYSSALDIKRTRTDGSAKPATNDWDKPSAKKNSSYEKYKASLHALFDGKIPLPEHLQKLTNEKNISQNELDVTDSQTGAAERPLRRRTLFSPSQALADQIRQSAMPDEIENAGRELKLAGFDLPCDEDILSKLLNQNDAGLLDEALDKLCELLTTQVAKSPKLLKTRLEQVALTTGSPQTRDKCLNLKRLIEQGISSTARS